ncbi:MAG TPA: DnaJ domain-containing protein [Bauldia sp.]|nr:DnaJ domain-containing protein [Bauldia sp.]
MNLNSKYFDSIRIRPNGAEAAASASPRCEWAGCDQPGGYRAPKGRHREGEYHNYCLDHVREYNKSYNYFAGMRDDDVVAYQRSASIGHRPTWNMGVGNVGARPQNWSEAFVDPFGFFGGSGPRRNGTENARPQRTLGNFARRSFVALDLDGSESGTEIKARYKELVKRLHPDANGGDRSLEDRLREIIQAYHYLKSAGFC